MSDSTILVPEPDLEDGSGGTTGDWVVIVYDNDHNTFEQVIEILQKATGCSLEEARMETWEVHHLGRSLVHHGDQPECERAAEIIRTIGIRVAVDKI